MEGRRERHGRAQRDQVRVPDEGRSLDAGGGDRGEHRGREAGDGTADQARQPPDGRDRADPEQRDLRGDRDRVRAREECRRCQQVVVDGAVVERPDRRLRAQQRDLAPIDEALQHEHVGALVRVPLPPLVEAREAEQGREREDGDQQRDLAPGGSGRGTGRDLGRAHPGASARRSGAPAATSSSVGASSSSSSSSAGALRPFALGVSKASGGRAASGRPATRSRARSRLTRS